MMLSAQDILNMKRPQQLFTDEKNIKSDYSKLAKVWHPDLNDNSEESNKVMRKINLLYREGLDLIQNGRWGGRGAVKFTCIDGKIHEIYYRTAHKFELGTMYIGNNVLAYVVDIVHKELFDNFQKVINNFQYANEKMETEVSKYLPQIIATFETTDGQLVMVIKKTPDMFLLYDVLQYYEGKLPARHMAWIMSSLYNLACYIDYAGLSHNSISLDSYFISPEYHSGALLGGWWYTVQQGLKMLGVTQKVYEIMPPHLRAGRQGSIQTDLESIRLIGRELLGDKNGTKLNDMGEIPLPLANWLRGVASESATKDYSGWRKVLEGSFGERKFVKMDLNDSKLYAGIK